MPSTARKTFTGALVDAQAVLDHALHLKSGARGPVPAGVPVYAFSSSATLLLSAAFEAYVENVVLEAGSHMGLSAAQAKEIENRVRNSHGVSARHIHAILSSIGIDPFYLDNVRWQRRSSGIRKEIDALASRRNKIAHGATPSRNWVSDVRTWKSQVEKLADKIDNDVSARVKQVTGITPW